MVRGKYAYFRNRHTTFHHHLFRAEVCNIYLKLPDILHKRKGKLCLMRAATTDGSERERHKREVNPSVFWGKQT